MAIEAGHKVLFVTLESMITRLTRARLENRVERQLQQFVYPKVFIIDESAWEGRERSIIRKSTYKERCASNCPQEVFDRITFQGQKLETAGKEL